MLKDLYEAIRKDAAPAIVEINGRTYSDRELVEARIPEPATLRVSTLTSLCDYLKANVDGLEIGMLICHVNSPDRVSLLSALTGAFDDRKTYMEARLDQLKLPFNAWLDAQSFNIALQACFCDPDGLKATDRGLVLKYISSVSAVAEAGVDDDGISQAVTVRRGIAGKGVDVLPNPVTLRPFRTFTEVEQPASSFVFRVRSEDSIKFMLAEADGGAWRAEAMNNIASFMRNNVPGLHVIA